VLDLPVRDDRTVSEVADLAPRITDRGDRRDRDAERLDRGGVRAGLVAVLTQMAIGMRMAVGVGVAVGLMNAAGRTLTGAQRVFDAFNHLLERECSRAEFQLGTWNVARALLTPDGDLSDLGCLKDAFNELTAVAFARLREQEAAFQVNSSLGWKTDGEVHGCSLVSGSEKRIGSPSMRGAMGWTLGWMT
jgi:hypothetical protein